jgi:hypothetical protein
MNSRLWGRGIVGATAMASAALITCGSAAADSIDELLEILGRKVASDMHVPAPKAIDDTYFTLGPTVRVAAGNKTEFVRIKDAACTANRFGIVGHTALENFYPGYTEWELDAIGRQAQQYSQTAPAVVAAYCKFTS